MPESTSSHSSTSTSFKGADVPCNGSDSEWNQIQPMSPDTVQNGTTLEWNELQPQNIILSTITSVTGQPQNIIPSTNTSANGQPQNIIPAPGSSANVSSAQHYNNFISNTNGQNHQVAYNPSSYMNIPHQSSAIPNGYNALQPPRGNNGQVINVPNLIRAPNGQIIGGSNWTNQAATGRFIPQAPIWSTTKTIGGVKKQKRVRTAFTSQQMMELEQEYSRARYLDRARRIELADILRLNERTIKIWFQNRRMKEKKDRNEVVEGVEEATTSESSPELDNIQMPMLIHEQYQNIPNAVYNQGGVYMEQFPVSSTSAPMSFPSLPMPQVPVSAQNVYQVPEYITEEQYHAQYQQQLQLQVQQYPSTYGTEVQKISSESTAQGEVVSSTNVPSDIIEKSWDLSWIKSMQTDEEY